MTGQILCHCVSSDCSKCPMRHTGTSGVRAEIAQIKSANIRWDSKEIDADLLPQMPVDAELKVKDGIVYFEGRRYQ